MRVPITGFPPNAPVAMYFGTVFEIVGPPIGASTTDDQGAAVVAGVIPDDAPEGETDVTVWASEECFVFAFVIVSLSPLGVRIDDDDVLAGQPVTLTAGGFLARSPVIVTFDSAMTQGECYPVQCRVLRSVRASAVGSAVIRLRIPRDASPGPHQLWVNGASADGLSEFSMRVDIRVVGGSTLPPTDAERVE